MPYLAINIAKYIINYCTEKNNPISNLKLQKILFFSWVDFYKQRQQPLFNDCICAWQFGPVVPEVYYNFCSYAGTPIIENYKIEIENADKSVLDKIIDSYINLSAYTLVEKSHKKNCSWDKTYQNGLGARNIISFELIKEIECAM